MSQDVGQARWTDSPRVQLALAVVFLVMAVLWIVLPAPGGWLHWVAAVALLGSAALWTTRAIRMTSRNRG